MMFRHHPPLTALSLGQALQGRLGSYTVYKKVQDTVWLARDQGKEIVVVKSVSGHPRVENERDILKRFQGRSTHIRPLIDEIQDPAKPTTIILRHLDEDLLDASIRKSLNRKEIISVSRSILEALSVLHEDGFVHTDVKPSNVFVNHSNDGSKIRFSEIQLGDFGASYHQESEWAKSATPIGAPMWSSPEVLMEIPWNTATDIWSFGTLVISLIFGGNFNIFRPKTARYGDEDYNVEVVQSQFRYFGPFPYSIREIVNDETLQSVLYLMKLNPPESMTPFSMVTEREVAKEDREFILKIMKMDWRDRPTAKELLEDQWFRKE
ncbi:serine/threonine protein kinase [Diaporthe helianthi]|uniref:Serine/threonine protein kinase n=1 Tax=Diaporthe helianthi TaxID=158607 RepID=A0A2P5I8Z4_DIAHE|nr:serine/threonine protein kinase [Diaporthe helianthi]